MMRGQPTPVTKTFDNVTSRQNADGLWIGNDVEKEGGGWRKTKTKGTGERASGGVPN